MLKQSSTVQGPQHFHKTSNPGWRGANSKTYKLHNKINLYEEESAVIAGMRVNALRTKVTGQFEETIK